MVAEGSAKSVDRNKWQHVHDFRQSVGADTLEINMLNQRRQKNAQLFEFAVGKGPGLAIDAGLDPQQGLEKDCVIVFYGFDVAPRPANNHLEQSVWIGPL